MDFEIVASGLLFPEAPVPMQGGSALRVEIARGTLTRLQSRADAMTTNIAFRGRDTRDARLTFSITGKPARARRPRPGLKLNFGI